MMKPLKGRTLEDLAQLLAYHERVMRVPTATLLTYNAAEEGAREVRAEIAKRELELVAIMCDDDRWDE
jgi:hypothetical protein